MNKDLAPYQKTIADKAVAILIAFKLVYLAMYMRTRKTTTSFLVAEKYGAKSVVYITVKGGKDSAVLKDIKMQYDTFKPNFKLKIVTHATAHKLNPDDYDLAIVDEADKLGKFPQTATAQRSVRKLVFNMPVILKSGTPLGDSSMSSVYNQLAVSRYSPFKDYFISKSFRDDYTGFYKWSHDYVQKQLVDGKMRFLQKKIFGNKTANDYSKADNSKIDAAIKHLYIYQSQQQAGFKHTAELIKLRVPMPLELQKMYVKLKKHGALQWNGNYTKAESPAQLIQKLSQLCGGALIFGDEEDNPLRKPTLLSAYKADFIKDKFKGKRIAIYYNYVGEGQILRHAFPDHVVSDVVFRETEGPCVYIGQTSSKCRGQDLSTADALIVYNMVFSYRDTEQVTARITTFTRDRPAPVYFLMSIGGIESKVYRSFASKQNFTAKYFRREEIKDKKPTRRQTPSVVPAVAAPFDFNNIIKA